MRAAAPFLWALRRLLMVNLDGQAAAGLVLRGALNPWLSDSFVPAWRPAFGSGDENGPAPGILGDVPDSGSSASGSSTPTDLGSVTQPQGKPGGPSGPSWGRLYLADASDQGGPKGSEGLDETGQLKAENELDRSTLKIGPGRPSLNDRDGRRSDRDGFAPAASRNPPRANESAELTEHRTGGGSSCASQESFCRPPSL